MSNEVTRGNSFLHTMLTADSSLSTLAPGGVWRNVAPQYTPGTTTNLPAPFAVYGWQGGGDTNTLNGFRIFSRNVWRLEAIGLTENYAAIASAADRLDELAKLVRNYVGADFYVNAMYRESPLDRDDLLDGIQWSHIGGLYRLIIQMM